MQRKLGFGAASALAMGWAVTGPGSPARAQEAVEPSVASERAAAPTEYIMPANGSARVAMSDADATEALRTLLAGTDFPLALRLKQLDNSWRRLSISGQYEMGEWMQMYSSMFGSTFKDVFYTRGQMVTLSGETYIVAYRPQSKTKPLDFTAMIRMGSDPAAKPPAPEKMTPETPLSLSLLNLRTIGSLNNIRPFDLNAELEINGKPTTEPTVGVATRADNTATDARLRQLGLALMMYTQDYDEVLPDTSSAAGTKKVLLPYVKDATVFQHPTTKKPFKPNPALSRKKLAHILNPRAFLAFYEDPAAPDGTRGLLFLDGHIKRIQEKEWSQVARNSKVFSSNAAASKPIRP